MLDIDVKPRALADVDLIVAHIAADNPAAASRFYSAVASTWQRLADSPQLGERKRFKSVELEGVRIWRVVGFHNYVVVYRPLDNRIEVLRVLHGARDWESLVDI